MPYPPKDGGAIATFSLAKNLSNFAEVHILAMNTSKHFFEIKNIPDEIKKQIKFYSTFVNTDISLFKLVKNLLFSKLPYNAERFINVDFEAHLISILFNEKFDIIQFEGLYVLPYLKIVRHMSDAIISYRAHNIETEIWERTLKSVSNLIKKIYLRILIKRLRKFEASFINKYDILIPITDRDKKHFAEKLHNEKPSLTIHTGFNIEEATKEEIQATESISYIGALDWTPNQEGLIWFLDNCFEELIRQKEDLNFVVAGRNAPKWLIKRLTSHKNITYLGEVEDAKKFITSANVMIVPLFSGSGMRIKIIEAMAYGKAIVTTPVGCEGINATNGENIYITENPATFVEYIIKLMNNNNLRYEVGEKARVFVSENFDNFAIAKKLFEFYSEYSQN